MIYLSLLWISISSLLGCALSLIQGQLQPWISLVSLVLGFIVSFILYRRRSLSVQSLRVSWPVGLLYFFVGVGIYFHSVFLFFKKDGSLWIQNSFNLGDMSFHWGTIRYLAKGASFWPENPIFMGHRFRYPFGMDFFNAFFENLAVPISTHLPVVTLFCLLLTFYALHVAGGPLLVFAIFFSGGFYAFWQTTPWDMAQINGSMDFKNLFLSVLLTQRGFLYALPAVLWIYCALRKSLGDRTESAEAQAAQWTPNFSEKVGLAILWGALGFFHLHTYAFVSLFFGLWILWERQLRTWLLTLVIAFLLGLPFVLNALWPEAGMNSLMHWSRGWARPEGRNYFLYWMQNMGPWILAMLASLVWLYRQKAWKSFVPLAFVAALFVLFAHLILAPWDWDNIKLLMWCYLFGFLWMKDWLWTSRGTFAKVGIWLVFFLPGFFLFAHSLPMYTHGIVWTSERELNKAEVLLDGHNVNAGLMIAPEYEHPALLLGYKLYMGYTGHVWSHGYNYYGREALMSRYFAGDQTVLAELAAEKVQLIYQGNLEKRRQGQWQAMPGLFKLGETMDHQLFKIE